MNGSKLDWFAAKGTLTPQDVTPWQTFSGKGAGCCFWHESNRTDANAKSKNGLRIAVFIKNAAKILLFLIYANIKKVKSALGEHFLQNR